ncbi:oligopeptide transporter, OPT family [Mycobacterium sp. CBMA293]|uniref:OPT family oligopeptide transporter n=1 Tax=unclassified Mycolicibacterium TaxID=2636767 RepID=UPI0012DF6764|nr:MULTISPECIES: oligopeptide transporter, OPT family [unclassified Mycolicibacterium]MUL49076.1 oligopeptide transporter, OPT family [Mycolicibacterium sp. CBMA 360]MUL60910.1 oligopeptide transporter, OPT family [Mycolicibacterium sp. CBMA 335]MUL71923.1 oligopeptide transporter, OPT family [Mycolicibacterium sp. CBMA 311]MUL95851.1 oligopeptide transporter, OPT family [Mycolicibacterium sp. CBMA 230]MUM09054.1 oligopeptide transporter, OPT family [Mycolicibacterium sp. CBMA 213]
MTTTPTPTTPTLRELTVRGVLLGGAITLVFTAANVYLGLKVGLTFATSIPAAVISMAVLRSFANHSVVENNIVQTIASAAGTLSAIIFVLPGLIMIGWWTGFPYWMTLAVCAVGGTLGVMYSIPLRRALVTGSDLPYPEGVAAAEVLKVGDSAGGVEANRTGLRVIIFGSLVSAGFGLLANMKVLANSVAAYFRIGAGGSMFGAGLSMAMIGVGHLVGMTVGVAMLVGLVIAFGVLLPIRTMGTLGTGQPIADIIDGVFVHEVRFVGAGAIAVAAIWTLLKILRPIIKGITDALASARDRRQGQLVDLTERDIPFPMVIGTVVALLLPIGLLLWEFNRGTALQGHSTGIITASLVFIFVIGLVIASVCGYMAGLIGSSNSPISGVGILTVLIAAVLIKVVFGSADGGQSAALVAYTLFAAAITFGVATISNDNLQDLKTGQLVGATPWKQQVALVIGVVFGSAIIPPVLNLMQRAFGFLGAPGAGDHALAAPQAALISSLVKGVFGGSLNWSLIGLGAIIGVVVILVDETLTRTSRFALPPLAVGMGIYLPMSLTLIIPVGSVLGYFYNRWAVQAGGDVERKKRLGVLLATGLIVGESLYGVVFAGFVGGTGSDEPFALFSNSGTPAEVIGVVAFVAALAWMYKRVQKIASNEPVSAGD